MKREIVNVTKHMSALKALVFRVNVKQATILHHG